MRSNRRKKTLLVYNVGALVLFGEIEPIIILFMYAGRRDVSTFSMIARNPTCLNYLPTGFIAVLDRRHETHGS